MICEKQLLNLINKVIDSPVDNQIDKYLPGITEKLAHLDKETLIKHFVSVEFNRFLSFYKNSPDLKPKEKFDPNKSTIKNLVRFHMNVGKKNGVGAQHILGLIKDKIQKRNIFIGKIDIMKSFSFFEIEQEQESEIIRKLNVVRKAGGMRPLKETALSEVGIFPIQNYLKGIIPPNRLTVMNDRDRERVKSLVKDLVFTLNDFWKSHKIPFRVREPRKSDLTKFKKINKRF